MKELKRLLPYLKRYRLGVAVGLLYVLTANVVDSLEPWLLGRTVDVIGWAIGIEYVLPLVGYILLLALVGGVLRFFMRRTLISISRRIEYDLLDDIFHHVQTLSASYFNRVRTGEIMSRATNDLSQARLVLGPGIMYSFNTVTILTYVLFMLVNIDPLLTVLALMPLPIMTVVVLFSARLLHRRYADVQEQLGEMTTAVQENISGIRVVKGHCRERDEIDSFLVRSGALRRSNLAAARIYGGLWPLMISTAGLSSVIILYFGGGMVIEGKITLGDMVAVFGYLELLLWPMMSLGWVISIVQRGSAAMKRINQLLDTEPEIEDKPGAAAPAKIDGAIALEGVCFSYGNGEVLHGIDLEIEAGQTIALVGPTGCGKSTMLQLIPRLYDPTAGSVRIDGLDARDLSLRSLRSAIGYVPQETFLFSETVGENIAFGAHGDATDAAAVERAAEAARVAAEVRAFPSGFDTLLGERGINLSGGQKQRVAIARALIGDPRILLLDDCLSAVDASTENDILESLRRERAGRTAIIVSHRLSSIMDADLIAVLDDGRIVERGTHEELLAAGGLYAQLWRKQQLSSELAAAG